MARTTDQTRRDQIATDALEVLRERGLQNCSMSTLAKALGMKRPTLYFYFSSIGDLYRYWLDRQRREEVAFVAARLVGHDHPLDVLDAFLRAEHAFYEERGLSDYTLLMAQFWASGSAADRDGLRALAAREVAPLHGMFVGLVQQGMQDGRIEPCDPEALVDLLFSTLDGTLLQAGIRGIDPAGPLDLFRSRILDPLRRAP